MSDTVIKVENLSKRYRLGAIGGATLRDDLQRLWARIRGKPDPLLKVDQLPLAPGSMPQAASLPHAPGPVPPANNGDGYIWALNDVSFEVQRGEILGIIGRNGAGKSTLLKVLSRITAPTTGTARIKGRIGSLLEVGTGFHPELTGRENIYLNGAILGMMNSEIRRKLDEIIAFAEIGKYVDTPVKRYSSGMYVRLAFAVAAHLDPEILLVDEVLAVGDVEFQKKCLGKMGDVAMEGRTVLFISHNMTSIQALCKRGIVLKSGCIAAEGEISSVLNKYLKSECERSCVVNWDSLETAPGDDRLRLKAVRVVSAGQVTGDVDIDKEFHIEVDYWNLQPESRRLVSIHIHNSMGITVLTSGNTPSVCLVPDPWYSRRYPKGLFRTTCTIPGMLLNDGPHSISLYINVNGAMDNILLVRNVVDFNVRETGAMRGEYLGKWIGTVRPRLDWRTVQLDKRIQEQADVGGPQS